jgi:hypothetical protein
MREIQKKLCLFARDSILCIFAEFCLLTCLIIFCTMVEEIMA